MKKQNILTQLNLATLAAALLFGSGPALRAGSHTWSGAVNGNWSTAGNWSAGGVPVIGEATLTLTFPGSATRTVMTNNIGALTVTSMTFSGSNYIVRGGSTITFASSLINVLCSGNSNTIESTLNLPSNFAVSVSDNDVMAFHTLTGAGSLLKYGEGEIHLRGTANNTLSGGYIVNVGRLVLAKTGIATAVAAPLTIIGFTNFGQLAFVSLTGSEQIAPNVDVTIHATGGLILNGHTNTINDLTVMAGTVLSGGGLLRLNGDIRLSAQDNVFPTPDLSPLLDGNLEFIGGFTTITVSNLTCEIEADIIENGGATDINKDGPGTLWLKGGGNYTGLLNIQQGTVRAEQAAALGSVAGSTLVSSGASLILGAGITTSESFELAGNGVNNQGALQIASGLVQIFGNISITGDTTVRVPLVGHQLLVNGSISGAGGLRKTGEGHLWVLGANANTFNGASFVDKGLLTLDKPDNVRAIGSVTVTNGATLTLASHEQIDNVGVLSLYTGSTFTMANFNETIGGLNLGASVTVDTGTGLLTLLGDTFVGTPYSTTNSVFAVVKGKLSLGGALRKFSSNPGSSALTLDCEVLNGSGTGGIWLTNGSIYLLRSNSFAGPVIVNGFCAASNSFAFGASGGGVILSNAPFTASSLGLLSPSMSVTGEALTNLTVSFLGYAGSNAWNGPIVTSNTLVFDGYWSTNQMTVDAPISGSGSLSVYGGTLRLLQANTYAGTTEVYGGPLVIRHPQALGGTAAGTLLNEGATLRLELPNGAAITNESLTFEYNGLTGHTNNLIVVAGAVSNTWTGPVTLPIPAQVRVADAAGTFVISSTISGPGSLEKQGPGKLILAGTNANTYTGDTVVNGGWLILNKPNGVQAVSNLTIHFPGQLEWAGSEQVADAATLSLDDTTGFLKNHSETITHLVMTNGYAGVANSTGTLTLLGDITVASGIMFISPTLVFPAGTHQITGDNNAYVYLSGSIRETGGSAGLKFTTCDPFLSASNSFSGPLVMDYGLLTIQHPAALGTSAGSTTLTNLGLLYLDLPANAVVADEALILASIGGNEIRMYNHATNTWTGPVTIQDRCRILHYETDGRLVVTGPVIGAGTLLCNTPGTLVLGGNTPNSFNGLTARAGTVRLAKSPGVPAVGGDVIIDNGGIADPWPVLLLDGPGQLPASTTVTIGSAGTFDLNGHATTIRQLLGSGPVIGNGQLTISNSLPGFDTVFSGDFNGTLIKQGLGLASFSGWFANGDLFVEAGTFNRTSLGVVGQTVIAPGAIVNSSGPQIFNFGALSGGGTLNISGVNTWVGGTGGGATFSGSILGTMFTKLGTGALTLTGPVALNSTTLVQNGTLLVNTTMGSPITVTPLAPNTTATLGGTGTLGNVVVTGAGARLAPGATTNVPSYGKLTVTNIALDGGAIYLCELGGTNAGVNLDQIDAKETTTLLNCGANFTAFGGGVVSNRYAVVKSAAAVNGIFSGKSEGSTFFPSAGRMMNITYLGGASGRDIVLMDLSAIPPGSFSGIQVLTNGTVQIGGQGTPGVLYDVQANANLNTTNWLVIGSVTGNFNGAFSFVDTNAPNFRRRFYRFLLP